MPSKSTYAKNLGHNIQAARQAIQMSQLDLQRAIGMRKTATSAYISKVESGTCGEIRMSTLRKIAKVLGVTVCELIAQPEK